MVAWARTIRNWFGDSWFRRWKRRREVATVELLNLIREHIKLAFKIVIILNCRYSYKSEEDQSHKLGQFGSVFLVTKPKARSYENSSGRRRIIQHRGLQNYSEASL